LPAWLKKAETIAKMGNIVTFGIRPTAPETGYGYIGVKLKKEDTFII